MLGTRIQRLRQEKRLSLTRLAAITRISKSYLSHIERNIQTNPSIEVLRKIALALEVDIQTLIMPRNNETSSEAQSLSSEKGWSNLLNNALESGFINEKILKEIILSIQKGKGKP